MPYVGLVGHSVKQPSANAFGQIDGIVVVLYEQNAYKIALIGSRGDLS